MRIHGSDLLSPPSIAVPATLFGVAAAPQRGPVASTAEASRGKACGRHCARLLRNAPRFPWLPAPRVTSWRGAGRRAGVPDGLGARRWPRGAASSPPGGVPGTPSHARCSREGSSPFRGRRGAAHGCRASTQGSPWCPRPGTAAPSSWGRDLEGTARTKNSSGTRRCVRRRHASGAVGAPWEGGELNS